VVLLLQNNNEVSPTKYRNVYYMYDMIYYMYDMIYYMYDMIYV